MTYIFRMSTVHHFRKTENACNCCEKVSGVPLLPPVASLLGHRIGVAPVPVGGGASLVLATDAEHGRAGGDVAEHEGRVSWRKKEENQDCHQCPILSCNNESTGSEGVIVLSVTLRTLAAETRLLYMNPAWFYCTADLPRSPPT